MLTFWYLATLLVVLILAAVFSCCWAVKKQSPSMGLLTLVLLFAIAVVCQQINRVAILLDNLK